MHPSASQAMTRLLREHVVPTIRRPDERLKVVDVGSLGTSYRPHVAQHGWEYVGVDIREGPNVDKVVPEFGKWDNEFLGGPFNVAISGQCFEHAHWPWQLMRQIKDVVVPGGFIIVIAPHTWRYHEHPWDCFRYWPEGMKGLCSWARLDVVEVGKNDNDTWVVARVPLVE